MVTELEQAITAVRRRLAQQKRRYALYARLEASLREDLHGVQLQLGLARADLRELQRKREALAPRLREAAQTRAAQLTSSSPSSR